MSRMLALGQSLGLNDDNLEDFVAVTWRAHASIGIGRDSFWQSAHEADLLDRILGALRQQPEARFGTLYAEAQPSER
ncbi:hypothetical protein D9M69_698220 [compost metagenome]